VAFIKHGEVVRLEDLKSLLEGETRVTVRAGGITPTMLAGLEQMGRDVRADGTQVTLTVEGEAALPGLARYLVEQGAELYALTPQRLALEDLFIQVVGTDGSL
jgi:ABC-2 type transport system ATP-binding protein